MLKHDEANPLAVFGLRKLDHCPPHFVKVKFDLTTNEKTITDWIWENLDGRFYFGDDYQNTPNAVGTTNLSLMMQKVVAFENPGEASYFALMLNTFNKFLW